jgi:CHASE2 domain-containing sensor protein
LQQTRGQRLNGHTMSIGLYTFALFCGIATVRATAIMDRAGVKDRSRVLSIISSLSLLTTFATVGLGFLLYPWWVPVVAGFAMAFLVGLIVIRATHAFFYKAIPVTGIVSMALCGYGWLKWAGA